MSPHWHIICHKSEHWCVTLFSDRFDSTNIFVLNVHLHVTVYISTLTTNIHQRSKDMSSSSWPPLSNFCTNAVHIWGRLYGFGLPLLQSFLDNVNLFLWYSNPFVSAHVQTKILSVMSFMSILILYSIPTNVAECYISANWTSFLNSNLYIVKILDHIMMDGQTIICCWPNYISPLIESVGK